MKGALTEQREVLLDMMDADEDDWPGVLDRHGVEDASRREQFRAFAESARE
jgi:hypothetical protein